MFPNLLNWLAAAPAVTAIIGLSPTRAYPHGEAPQRVQAPYVTYFMVTGQPEDYLTCLPTVDHYTIQVDCWGNADGTGSTQTQALARAVRSALQVHGHLVAYIADGRDFETMRYRVGMRFDFWHPR